MTESERRVLKARLIEAGLWNADERGDPTVDANAAKELERRASEKHGVRFVGFSVAHAGATSMNSIAIYRGDDVLLRVTGNTQAEVVCFAAIASAALP